MMLKYVYSRPIGDDYNNLPDDEEMTQVIQHTPPPCRPCRVLLCPKTAQLLQHSASEGISQTERGEQVKIFRPNTGH